MGTLTDSLFTVLMSWVRGLVNALWALFSSDHTTALEFLGKDGKLTGVRVQEIDWKPNPEGGRPLMVEKGKPEVIKCEMVLLAMGFLKPEQPAFADNVFVCGDAATGASLVVRAMAGGRKAAADVDKYLNR